MFNSKNIHKMVTMVTGAVGKHPIAKSGDAEFEKQVVWLRNATDRDRGRRRRLLKHVKAQCQKSTASESPISSDHELE